jgi:hypothetical protein
MVVSSGLYHLEVSEAEGTFPRPRSFQNLHPSLEISFQWTLVVERWLWQLALEGTLISLVEAWILSPETQLLPVFR